MRQIFLLAALAACTVPWPLKAGKDPKPLTGVTNMQVVIDLEEPSDAQHCGITMSQLQTDVEIRLRRSGVIVGDDPNSPFVYFLYADVNTLWSSGCIFNIELWFLQTVYVPPSGATTAALTWSTGALGTTASTDGYKIRNRLGDLVDMFMNDWLSVNPPSKTKTSP